MLYYNILYLLLDYVSVDEPRVSGETRVTSARTTSSASAYFRARPYDMIKQHMT